MRTRFRRGLSNSAIHTHFPPVLPHGNSALKHVLDSLAFHRMSISEPFSLDQCVSQAMDSSHVSLVHMHLAENSFDFYRCDRRVSLGLNLQNLQKIMRCSNKGDNVALMAEDGGDTLKITFSNESEFDSLCIDWT